MAMHSVRDSASSSSSALKRALVRVWASMYLAGVREATHTLPSMLVQPRPA